MIRIIKELNIEVTKPNIFQAIVAKQYDMNTRFLKVTLMDCGTRIEIPSTETTKVIINAKRTDGQSKGFDGVINADGTVTVPLHSWMLELEGEVICDISVIDTDKKLTTTSFTLMVEKATYGGNDVTSDPQYDVLVELIERVENLESGAADQTYDPESTNAQSGKAVAEAIASIGNKITKIGEFIEITDISPSEHNVDVKLSSDTTTDFSNVTLFTSGKNLFNLSNFSTDKNYVNVVVNEDGSATITNTNQWADKEVKWDIDVPKNTDLVITVPQYEKAFNIYSINEDNTYKLKFQIKSTDTIKTKTFNTENFNKFRIVSQVAIEQTVTLSGLQLEVGEVSTTFEPASIKSYIANSNGTVDDVKSIYPKMLMFTNVNGVNIEATYNAEDEVLKTVDVKIAESEQRTDVKIAESEQRLIETLGNDSPFFGKKVVFLGDSITEGMSPEYTTGRTTPANMANHGHSKYWEITAEKLGVDSVVGYGVTGTCITKTDLNSGLDFVERFSAMDDDADLVCVFGGTNDYGLAIPLGTINDSADMSTSFYSALKYLIIGLMKKYPNARIIFCTPLPRFDLSEVSTVSGLKSTRKEKYTKVVESGKWYYYDWETSEWAEDDTYNQALTDGTATEDYTDEYDHSYRIGKIKNNQGHMLSDYVNAIKEVCNMYSIPVCDFNTISRIYPYTRKSRYDNIGDGLHPHSNQHIIMGRLLANAIKEKC